MRILVVEDEESLNSVLVKQLKKQGYSVDSCGDGLDAEEYVRMSDYDCVLLDVNLPGKSGFDVLRGMRADGNESPVLMLTARDSIEDKVTGLDTGADDYLTKPFSFEELLARIRMLTRKKTGVKTNVHEIADLKLDVNAKRVERAGKVIDLSAKEYALLEYLIMNKGTVLSRENIEEHLWDYDYEGASNMVDVYIRYLRKKVDEPFGVKLIRTVRGQGYVLREDE